MMLYDYDFIKNQDILKKEAIARLSRLKVSDDVIGSLKNDNLILCSEYGKLIEVPEDIKTKIVSFEKKSGCFVFHVVHNSIYGMDIFNCLSVSPYLEDWNFENDLINQGWAMAYTINLSTPDYSESGSIELKHFGNALIRTR